MMARLLRGDVIPDMGILLQVWPRRTAGNGWKAQALRARAVQLLIWRMMPLTFAARLAIWLASVASV